MALVALDHGLLDVVEGAVGELLGEYFEGLGLTFNDVFAANLEDIQQLLGDGDHQATLQHAADCLYLLGIVAMEKGGPVSLEFVWAMKFYDMAHAPTSALKAGTEYVDGLLWVRGSADPQAAVSFFEQTLIPTQKRWGLVGHTLELWTLYAVALACVGRHVDAAFRIQSMQPYVSGLCAQEVAVLNRRTEMVQGLKSGQVRYVHGQLLDRSGLPCFGEALQVVGARPKPE